MLRERKLEGLDETMVVLQVPPGASTGALLDQLRLRDPDGSYDYNHVYMGSEAERAWLPAGRPGPELATA
ncbi:hypothetical protein LP420_27005 [Massilia sp. B-10]|nr:hypothetical protein LP420_27005 [Massilia sp. B-10]